MNMNHWRKMGWKKIMDNKELSVKLLFNTREKRYV